MTPLEPTLTAFDRRVLAALPAWPPLGARPVTLDLRNAWQVAEQLQEYDVATVRDTLRGLDHLGYAWSKGWGKGQRWTATWRREDLTDGTP